MLFGSYKEAIAMAQSALNEARETRSDLKSHIDVCAVRADQVQKTLDGQSDTLDKIKAFLTRSTFGVMALLLTVLGTILLQFAQHIRWAP